MSSLQISLAVAGGLVLAAVVAHSAWSSRKNAPRQPQPELPPVQGADAPGESLSEDQRQEPRFDGALAPLPHPEKKLGLDALIDVIAPIALDGLVSGDAALAAMPSTRRAGSKPFAIEGWNDALRQWETPAAGQRYRAFQAGVQLANRTGHLNEIEYSEFVMKAQGFADAVNGAPEFPDMIEEVGRARELDQFAGDHDAQLEFTLRARSAAWSPGYVQQHAARLGFVAGSLPGRMVLPSVTPGMPALLGLAFDSQAALSEDPDQSAIREVALSLDVPQVPREERPFVRLRDAAIALAASMDGLITDDNRQVIPVESLDRIGAELEQLYDTLEARDLAAGSPQARRLFS